MLVKYSQNWFAMLLASVFSSPFIKKCLGKFLLTLDCCNRSLILVHVFLILCLYFSNIEW